MPDFNQTPISVDEFMYPKSEPSSTSDSASEGENSYSSYYNMIPNVPPVSMAATMSNYNPSISGAVEANSKDKENVPPTNPNGKCL